MILLRDEDLGSRSHPRRAFLNNPDNGPCGETVFGLPKASGFATWAPPDGSNTAVPTYASGLSKEGTEGQPLTRLLPATVPAITSVGPLLDGL